MRITAANLWLSPPLAWWSIPGQFGPGVSHGHQTTMPLHKELFDVIDKQVKTTADAVAGVRDGSTVLVAGFGAVGVADNLLDALHEQGARELTIVANNSGNGDYGLARLINSGRVRKVICSYPRSGDYSAFLKAYRAKSLELELVPQGTISERMRCHAAGLGGFFSPVSAGTKLAAPWTWRSAPGKSVSLWSTPAR